MRPLTPDEGGGYLVEFPDLPGCMSDGQTVAEAVANPRDAQAAWIAAMREAGRPIPAPGADPADGYPANGAAHPPLPASLIGRAGQAGGREPEHAGRGAAGRGAGAAGGGLVLYRNILVASSIKNCLCDDTGAARVGHSGPRH